jgi:hypothetical protein
MLKDKRAGGFEEVSKPSIGIHMKKKKNYHGRNGAKETGRCVARRAKSRHSRHIHDAFRIKGQTW